MEIFCCLCLKEASDALNLFDEKGMEFGVAQILGKHFWFEPCQNDSITTCICLQCWSIVNDFHKFYLIIEEAHQHQADLKCSNEKLHDLEAQQDSELLEQPVQQLEIAIDIKEEFMDNNIWQQHIGGHMDRTESNPLEDIETKYISIDENQTHLLTENIQDDQVKQQYVKEETASSKDHNYKPRTLTDQPCRPERRKSSKRAKSLVTNQIVPAKRKRRCKKDTSQKIERRTITSSSKGKRQKRQTMMTERDEELIKKYISMGCELCPFVAENFLELSEHFRIQHESHKPYVVCCGRKLNKRFLIVQHAYKHEDPEFYKCKECGKIFSDGYVLRSHMLANHVPDEDLTFSCDQCPKKFSRRYLLELHKPSHIPPEERNFWCNKCPQPKVFASDHLLQIHTNMRHTKAPNVCHVCAKEIRDNQAFEKHVRLHFEDSGPRVKCPHPDCDRWLKDEDNLKQHIRRHNDEGKTFKCDECEKVCKNRRSLMSHIKYAHTNETFCCEECNKTFKKALSLREHMAQHTGETLYKCPFCTRTFNSNANMHSHKKKMHPLEWDNWRKTKRGSSQQLVGSNSNELKTKSFDNVNYAGNSINEAILMEHNLV